MRIAIISDTHIGEHRKEPPAGFWEIVDSADAVAHLGDFTGLAFAEWLAAGRTFYGVAGNCDPWEVRQLYPQVTVFELGGVKVVMTHKFPNDPCAAERFVEPYRRQGASVILYGHTHKAADREVAGVRALNPGSACDARGGPKTAGILTVSGGRASWRVETIGKR